MLAPTMCRRNVGTGVFDDPLCKYWIGCFGASGGRPLRVLIFLHYVSKQVNAAGFVLACTAGIAAQIGK